MLQARSTEWRWVKRRSSRARRIVRAIDSVERIMPVPVQCGHGLVEPSRTPVLKRWRDISNKPKWLILPTWMRALSWRKHSLMRRSTARLLRRSSISMKSITTRPARSLKRSCREISVAASRFVLRAVSSIECSLVERPEFTSIETSASV